MSATLNLRKKGNKVGCSISLDRQNVLVEDFPYCSAIEFENHVKLVISSIVFICIRDVPVEAHIVKQ